MVISTKAKGRIFEKKGGREGFLLNPSVSVHVIPSGIIGARVNNTKTALGFPPSVIAYYLIDSV